MGDEMANADQREIARQLLEEHGQTYEEEIGIHVERNTPSPLFRLLCASILFSTRISADTAVSAARALADAGWTTPQKMDDSTWSQRARVLNRSGYARYDERTSTMLGDTATFLLGRYDGDLRNLREEAERDPGAERKLLKEFKGMGDVGVDIFFREVQVAWDELFPFADDRALKSARKLKLPKDPNSLADLVAKKDFARLVAALVRVELANEHKEVLEAVEGE